MIHWGRSLPLAAFFSLASLGSAGAQAASMDAYIAPIFTFGYPLHDVENPWTAPTQSSQARYGFRLETGRLSDNIAMDFRFATGSSYQDYGLVFKGYYPWEVTPSFIIVSGLGFGGSFSPGFPTDPRARTFFDIILNPYLRFVYDTGSQFAVFLETGATFVPERDFSEGSPDADVRSKLRLEANLGVMLDFDKIEEAGGFDIGPRAEHAKSGFNWGFKGGIPLSTVSQTTSAGAAVTSNAYGTGYMGGLSFDLGSSSYGLMLDLLLANRKYASNQGYAASQKRVETPVQFRYLTGHPVYLFTGLGGYAAFPLGDASYMVGGSPSTTTTQSAMDWGALGSIGFGLPGTMLTLTMEVRYLYGFANLIKNPSGTASSHHRSWDLMVGFLF